MGHMQGSKIHQSGEFLGEGLADVLPATRDAMDSLDQLVRRVVLRQVARGAGAQRAQGPLVFRMHAQHEHPHAGKRLTELADGLDERRPGHADIEEHDINRCAGEQAEELRRRGGFASDRDPSSFGGNTTEALPDDWMVIGDGDADHGMSRLHGIRNDTLVPKAGLPTILSSPPHASARSRMPTSPSDVVPSMRSGGIPRPLSITSSVRSSCVLTIRMKTRVAREWRATLVSDSCRIRNAEVPRWSSILAPATEMSRSTGIPVRKANSCACHSSAASNPSWSSTLGRSSV